MGYDSSQADYEYAYPSLQQSMLAGTAGQAGAHLQQQAQQQHAQQQQIREFQPTMGLQGQEVGYYGPAAGSGGMAMSGMGTFLHGQGTGAGVQPVSRCPPSVQATRMSTCLPSQVVEPCR